MPSAECYLCARRPAPHPRSQVPETFTAHAFARSQESDSLCERCAWVLKLRCWYQKTDGNWSILFARAFSWLWVNSQLVVPTIGPELSIAGKRGGTFPVVSNLATRSDIRGWLLEPPTPPFEMVVAQSGQKHTLPFAVTGWDREYFALLFEMDTVWIRKTQLRGLLEIYESLLDLGFSKTEIDTGEYRGERLAKSLTPWWPLEEKIVPYRGSRLLELVSFVAGRSITKDTTNA
ncbi:hypothetical protein [Gloeobacter morelensis]|uniref:hypothetical protein n=1 Tax=Gloeobacter morelensis TaxID=2907343 RepID=UPI001E5EF80A|nr:hypothetical protein [Gloeobacter morelensis]UFP97184.1 hypothetical protein ISF26_23985 [Gloeobacter morelensis MG652769]